MTTTRGLAPGPRPVATAGTVLGASLAMVLAWTTIGRRIDEASHRGGRRW